MHLGAGRASPRLGGAASADGHRAFAPLPRARALPALGEPLAAEAAHLLDHRHERLALGRQAVFDARRHFRIRPALDDPLGLERAQAKRKRAWTDAVEGALQL